MANSTKWIGADKPSLEANAEDEYQVDVPGYDLRRILLAQDPLAAANAFFRSDTDYPCNCAWHTHVSALPPLF